MGLYKNIVYISQGGIVENMLSINNLNFSLQ